MTDADSVADDMGLAQCANGDDCFGSGRKRHQLQGDQCLICLRAERDEL